MHIESSAKTPQKQTSIANILPLPTKKYTLVLDLDETLIHSHVQYK